MKHGGVSAILFMHRPWTPHVIVITASKTEYSPSFRDDQCEFVPQAKVLRVQNLAIAADQTVIRLLHLK